MNHPLNHVLLWTQYWSNDKNMVWTLYQQLRTEIPSPQKYLWDMLVICFFSFFWKAPLPPCQLLSILLLVVGIVTSQVVTLYMWKCRTTHLSNTHTLSLSHLLVCVCFLLHYASLNISAHTQANQYIESFHKKKIRECDASPTPSPTPYPSLYPSPSFPSPLWSAISLIGNYQTILFLTPLPFFFLPPFSLSFFHSSRLFYCQWLHVVIRKTK